MLDNHSETYFCPDRPVLRIISPDRGGITYQSDEEDSSKYYLFLLGALSHGLIKDNKKKKSDDPIKNLEFSLTIEDNLIKGTIDKSREVTCKINGFTELGDYISTKVAKIKCTGNKSNNSNVDLSLNFKNSKNQLLNNLVIMWPNELGEDSKQISGYKIEVLNMKTDDYGCFDNKFYFYINILDLSYEPNLYFNIPLSSPKNMEASCQIYNSYILKCFVDLTTNKINSGNKIELLKIKKDIHTRNGNEVNYDSSKVPEINGYLIAEENCGNNVVVGALKNVGFSYLQIILIIMGVIAFIVVMIIFIAYLILHHIIAKNRKGKYYAHKEEEKKVSTTIGVKDTIAAVQPTEHTLNKLQNK